MNASSSRKCGNQRDGLPCLFAESLFFMRRFSLTLFDVPEHKRTFSTCGEQIELRTRKQSIYKMDPMSVKRNKGRSVSFESAIKPRFSVGSIQNFFGESYLPDRWLKKGEFSEKESVLTSDVIQQMEPNPESHDNKTFTYDEVNNNDYFVSVFGKKGKNVGEFEDAKNITYLAKNQVIITDFVNSRLQICNESTRTITVFAPHEINLPWATAITNDNKIAVTLNKYRCVKVLNMAGEVTNTFGKDYFVRPTGLAIDKKGNYIICDMLTDKVSMFDCDGNFIRLVGNPVNKEECFSKPSYVTVSSNGDIIVSDSGHHKIKVFNSKGKFIRSVGCFGKGYNQFKSPYGVTTNKCGDIFVADHYNSRISMFTRDGVFVRHIVTSEHGLVHPQGLTISEDLHLYITHGHLKASEILKFKLTNDSDYKPTRTLSHL